MGQPNPWTTLAHGSAGGLMNRSLRLLAAILSQSKIEESVPKQLAQCWFPGLAISRSKI